MTGALAASLPPSSARAPSARLGRLSQAAQRRMAGLLFAVLIATTAWITLDGAVGASPLLPYSPYFTGWLRHVTGQRLTYDVFFGCLLGFTAAYAALLPLAGRLSTRAIVALLAVLYLIVFIGPVLLSTDLFSYLAYARMGALHGLNPFTHHPSQIHQDAIYKFVGADWIKTPSAYGPLYSLISYPIALLGLVGGIWGMKLMAMAGCICADWLAWRCAKIRRLDPKLTLLLVGANPLVLIYSLASFHNDFIMIALMMVAVTLSLTAPVAGEGQVPDGEPTAEVSRARRRSPLAMIGIDGPTARHEAWGAAALVAGALVKASVAAMLPFMILGRRRLGAFSGALLAAVIGLLGAFLIFGPHGADIVSVLNRNSAYVSTDSFATELSHLLGKPGVYPIDHTILKGILAVVLCYLLYRTWRGYDWIAAAGWALLAITVTTTWLLAWYLIWPLPIAAISRDRRLLWATLAVQALFILHQIAPLFTPE